MFFYEIKGHMQKLICMGIYCSNDKRRATFYVECKLQQLDFVKVTVNKMWVFFTDHHKHTITCADVSETMASYFYQ